MAARLIVERTCERCGEEAAIEDGKSHAWTRLDGLYRLEISTRYRSGDPTKGLPKNGGDLCPACGESFLKWWGAARAATVIEHADGE